MTYPTTEQVEKARQASLADFFIQNGFEAELTRNELHVKGYGGLYINTDTNEWYCFSQADKHGGRNAINCLTDILGMDFKTAVEALTGENISYGVYKPTEQPPPKSKELIIPERAESMRNVFAYLCQTRKIDSKIVSDLAHNGLLYQDKRGNAVFLHIDDNGEILGAELQGTNTYQRFKGVAAGTADSVFSLKVGTPNKVYVFESAIDLLSFRQLASPNKVQDSVLVSMAGLKPSTLKTFAERGLPLYACVDNDEAGSRFISDNNLIPCNKVLADSGVKDFNELLQKTISTRELIDKSQSAQNLPTDPSNVKPPPPSHKVRR